MTVVAIGTACVSEIAPFLDFGPLISDLRDDPRYAELFERIGLEP